MLKKHFGFGKDKNSLNFEIIRNGLTIKSVPYFGAYVKARGFQKMQTNIILFFMRYLIVM